MDAQPGGVLHLQELIGGQIVLKDRVRNTRVQIAYKKLTEAELDTFIRMRITRLTEEYTAKGKNGVRQIHICLYYYLFQAEKRTTERRKSREPAESSVMDSVPVLF